MSETNINTKKEQEGENKVPEEALSLPKGVYNANWRDDVVDEAEDETKEVTSFETFENEEEYKSSEIVSQEAEYLISAFNREKYQGIGKKVLSLSVFK